MHRLTPKGASFSPGTPQKEFLHLTRPTDIDVDANSRIYISSWKGATFDWAGPNVGYIVQLRPKGYTPEPLPNFDKLSKKELADLLGDRSHRRRLAAERTLVRRGLIKNPVGLLDVTGTGPLPALEREMILSRDYQSPVSPEMVATIFTHALSGDYFDILPVARKNNVKEYAIRAFGEPDHKPTEHELAIILSGLNDNRPRVRLQAVIACGFQNLTNAAPELAARIADEDPVVSHTVVEALKRLQAADVCWPFLDSSETPKRAAALRVLQGIHRSDVVDGLTERLQREKDSTRRIGLFTALSRLYFTDAKWKGDSWGTRPDTSGPYYEPAVWEESPRILRALNDAVEKASGDELAALSAELNRHKVQSETALSKILDAASTDVKMMPAAVGQLSRADKVPPSAEALLEKAATTEKLDDIPRAQAILALAKVKSDDAARAGLEGLAKLQQSQNSETEGLRRQARSAFFKNGPVQNRADLLDEISARGGEVGLMADAALLSFGNKEAFEKAWSKPTRKIQLLKAMAVLERANYREQVLEAEEDSNPEIAKQAKQTARALRLDRPRRNSPKVETMSVADAIAAVVKTKGDVELGKKLFTQQTCVNCHTTTQSEPQRGPYLGNIAATYKRPELAEAILLPNKSIAQGFVANHFELKNGDEHDGFVTLEAADKVTIRDTTSQEYTFATKDIVKRTKLEKSLMPEGLAGGLTIQEFASLLDYLESLNPK
jgi:putative heme-binding domain-containing protein